MREHQFVAATDNLDYTFERVKGVRNVLLGGSGFFIDKFRATQSEAIVWLHGHGNVFEVSARRGRADRRRGRRLALQGPERPARVGLARPQDGDVRRRRQADLEPLHRARPARHPDDVHQSRGGSRTAARRTSRPPRRAASPARCCGASPSSRQAEPAATGPRLPLRMAASIYLICGDDDSKLDAWRARLRRRAEERRRGRRARELRRAHRGPRRRSPPRWRR